MVYLVLQHERHVVVKLLLLQHVLLQMVKQSHTNDQLRSTKSHLYKLWLEMVQTLASVNLENVTMVLLSMQVEIHQH